MRIWTDGVVVRAWQIEGVLASGPEGVTWEARDEDELYYQPDFVVAPSPSGEDLAKDVVHPDGVRRIDAAAVDEETLAEVLREGRDTPTFQIGAPGDVPAFETKLEMDAPPVQWPKGLLWKELDDRFSDAKAFLDCTEPFEPRSVRITSNQFGVSVAASGTGQIALMRPMGKKLEPLVRVPTAAESRAYVSAIPLEQGALLVVTSYGEKRSKGAVIRVDDSGKVLARWPKKKAAAPAAGSFLVATLLSPDQVVVCHGKNIAVLRVDGLEPIASAKGAAIASDVWAGADGTFAVCGEKLFQAGRIEKSKLKLQAKVVPKGLVREEQKASKPPITWMPDKEEGPTTVEAAAEKTPPWKAEAGKPFTLKMRLRSKGVAGKGLRMRVLGPAIDKGLIELVEAKSGTRKAKFKDGACELPAVQIPQGYMRPIRPKPKNELQKLRGLELLEKSHIELELTGKGLKKGSGLLKLQIGGLEGDLFRWTRPFKVE